MSEENKIIYCTHCGKENDGSSKFCSNCGTKLESALSQSDEQPVQTEGVFSGEETKPVYEKITDAEEEKPTPIPQSEEKQSYDNADQFRSNSYYETPPTQYYSTEQNESKQGGGNIGFAIASLVCGILSLLCFCLTLFSAMLAIAAIVLGIITLCFKYDGKGMAIAGIITGGIGMVVVVFSLIVSVSASYKDLVEELMYELY